MNSDSANENRGRAFRKLLVRLVLVSLSFVSVSTTLSALPGATTNFWYLYFSPVLVSAISFGLRGALVGSVAALVSLIVLLLRLQQLVALAPESLAFHMLLFGAAPQAGLGQIVDTAVLARAGEEVVQAVVAGNRDGFALAVGQVGLGFFCMALTACCIGRQVDRQRRQDAVISEQARTDHLTGLANHRGLMERLDEAVAEGVPFSLLLLDVDGLKGINDRFGHAAGDEALRHAGKNMREMIRNASDLAARYGGDEFAILVAGDADGEAGVRVAKRLLQALSEKPASLPGGQKMPLRVSIGIARAFEDGPEAGQLLVVADQGMYTAKEAGGQLVIRGKAVSGFIRPRIGRRALSLG